MLVPLQNLLLSLPPLPLNPLPTQTASLGLEANEMANCNDFRQSAYDVVIQVVANVAMALRRRISDSRKHLDSEPERLFTPQKELGHGGFGLMDHVVYRLWWNHFARKGIPCDRSFEKDKEAIESLRTNWKH
jgi:hypothetical protein